MQNWQMYRQFMPDGMAAFFQGSYFWNMPRLEVSAGQLTI
jgi:hypothetical protein